MSQRFFCYSTSHSSVSWKTVHLSTYSLGVDASYVKKNICILLVSICTMSQIHDGNTTSSRFLGTFYSRPDRIISTSNSLLLLFKSDSSQNYKGFQAFYTSEGKSNLVLLQTVQLGNSMIKYISLKEDEIKVESVALASY